MEEGKIVGIDITCIGKKLYTKEECPVCYEKTADDDFLLCGHWLCTVCFRKLKICPLCNFPLRININLSYMSSILKNI